MMMRQSSISGYKKVKIFFRTFLAHLFSHVGLCVLVVGYAVLGALVFESLESGLEIQQRLNKTRTLKKVRQKLTYHLWTITGIFLILHSHIYT